MVTEQHPIRQAFRKAKPARDKAREDKQREAEARADKQRKRKRRRRRKRKRRRDDDDEREAEAKRVLNAARRDINRARAREIQVQADGAQATANAAQSLVGAPGGVATSQSMMAAHRMGIVANQLEHLARDAGDPQRQARLQSLQRQIVGNMGDPVTTAVLAAELQREAMELAAALSQPA